MSPAKRSKKRSNLNKGFTLMEVLLVIGLLAMIFGLTAFSGMDSYHGSSFRNERDGMIGALQRARNQATNSICLGGAGCTGSLPHGVHFTNTEYTIFQGNAYNAADPLNDVIDINAPIQMSLGGFTDVIFSQFSGDASTVPSGTPSLTLTDSITGRNSVITIGGFGQITWTN